MATAKPAKSRSSRIGHNTFFLYGSEIAARLFSMLAFIYLNRQWVEVSIYGQYALVVNWIGIFATFSDLGLNALTVRDVAARKNLANHYLRNVMFLRSGFSLLFMALLMFLGQALHYEGLVQTALVVLGLRMVLDCVSGGYVYLLQAHERMGLHGFIVMVASLFRFLGIVVVVRAGGGVIGACWVWVVVSALTLIVLAVIGAKKNWVPRYKRWDAGESLDLLKKALPLAAFWSLQTLYYRVDEVVLKSLTDNTAVGHYDAAYKVLNVTLLLSQLFGLATLPVFSSIQKNADLFGRVALRSLKVLVFLGLPITVGGYFLGVPLLIAISGPRYTFSGILFAILVLSTIPFFISNLYINILTVKNPKVLNGMYLVLFALNLALNFLLIPRMGPQGAAWATVWCEVVGLAWGLWLILPYLKTRLTVPLWRPFLACAGASALMGTAMFQDRGLYWLVLGPVVYGIGLFLFKGLDKDDWVSLKSVLKI